MNNTRRFWLTTLLAWLVFIGIDFLFHASILNELWKEEIDSFKPAIDLFFLIPLGYASFYLLTILVGYVFNKIYREKPSRKDVIIFSLIFGLLFSVSNFLGWYSFLSIPLKHLIFFNLVYLIEICVVVLIYYIAMFTGKYKKIVWRILLSFFILIISGIIIQNLI